MWVENSSTLRRTALYVGRELQVLWGVRLCMWVENSSTLRRTVLYVGRELKYSEAYGFVCG